MKRKLNLLLLALVIGSVCHGGNVAAQGVSASQDKSPSLEEALDQIRSGLSNAGTRLTFSTADGRIVDTRRYQFISSDGCSLQILMEVDSTRGGRTSHGRFVETIPLDALDVARIGVRQLGPVSDAGPIFVKGLSSSEDGGRRAFSVILSTGTNRKTLTYTVEQTYDWSSSREYFNGKGSQFGINFIDRRAAEQLAAAFRQASRSCQAKERSKP